MWSFDPERVRENVRKASTDDLLDRCTVYREGMEAEAIQIIEEELQSRGVTREQIQAHAASYEGQVLVDAQGIAYRCSFCDEPAVEARRGWHMFWRLIPLFPRLFYYCSAHRPAR